jgi:hypothetical protein
VTDERKRDGESRLWVNNNRATAHAFLSISAAGQALRSKQRCPTFPLPFPLRLRVSGRHTGDARARAAVHEWHGVRLADAARPKASPAPASAGGWPKELHLPEKSIDDEPA